MEPRTHPSGPRRAAALVVLGLAQVAEVLDFSIVNLALPSMRRDLHFTTDTVQWVISAYAIALGGLLIALGPLAGPPRLRTGGAEPHPDRSLGRRLRHGRGGDAR